MPGENGEEQSHAQDPGHLGHVVVLHRRHHGAQDAAPTPEYVTRPAAPETGKAPGLKATELSPKVRKFQLVFAKGDEVGAGLAEFANKKSPRRTAISPPSAPS